jgi:hypothetical protein
MSSRPPNHAPVQQKFDNVTEAVSGTAFLLNSQSREVRLGDYELKHVKIGSEDTTISLKINFKRMQENLNKSLQI